MTTAAFLRTRNRVVSRVTLLIVLMAVVAVSGLTSQMFAFQVQPTGPKIWLGERQPLAMQQGGAASTVTRPAGGRAAVIAGDAGGVSPTTSTAAAQPLSLATGDVNEDGFADLLVGYNGYISIQPGNVDAFAPQSDASFQAVIHGQFPAPFLSQGIQLTTPVNPDFMAVGHFTASGHNDLVVAAKGGTALFVFAGDGRGNFAPPTQLNLPGSVTTMIGGDLGFGKGFQNLILGMTGPSGPELAIFVGGQDGVDPVAAFPLSGAPTNLQFGDFGDGQNDVAFLAGGQVQILRAATMQLQTVSLPISATALALGTFVHDKIPGLQMALLTSDGTIHIAVHNEFAPGARSNDELIALRQAAPLMEPNPLLPAKAFPANGWKIVEDINAAAIFPAGQTPVMFRTRISDHHMDDVMVLNGASGLLTVVQHPNLDPGATSFAAAVLSTRPYSGSPIAAIPQRINVDGRAGVLAIHAGESTPSMLMPLPDPTFTVNRTDDPAPHNPISGACNGVANDCSLREAVLKANSIAGADTISLPAGTYTLTRPRPTNQCNPTCDFSGNTGTLEVTDTLTIMGAGQATTIIQGGTDQTTSVDKVFSFNQDITAFTGATVSLSNLTIQNGHNRGNAATIQDGFGGAFDFDTGTGGTATLTLTNVTLQNNAVFDGDGGGFTIFTHSRCLRGPARAMECP